MGMHTVIISFVLCLSICIIVFMKIVYIKRDVFKIRNIRKGYFQIRKCLIFEKLYKQKIVPGIFRFVSMLF